MQKILIYGYGNPGRQDDGLGAGFVELAEKWIEENKIANVDTDCNYQLNIEDAAVVSEYDMVIFVDASIINDIDDFKLEKISPDNAQIEFTMHAVSVGYVIDLCKKIYNKTPEAYILHIKGYDFDFKEELSEKAKTNMKEAFKYLKNFITERQKSFDA